MGTRVLEDESSLARIEYPYKGDHYVISLLINLIKAVLLIGGGTWGQGG